MANWHHVTVHNPCAICDKTDWYARSTDGTWALCRRVDTGLGLHKLDKAGAACWLYRLNGNAPRRQPCPEVMLSPHAACADAATLDVVYRTLLAAALAHEVAAAVNTLRQRLGKVQA